MVFRFFIEGGVEGVGGGFCNPQLLNQGRIQGGGGTRRAPPKIGKDMIFLRKMVIFHTKYPNKKFKVRPPLTWNPGSAPDIWYEIDIATPKSSEGNFSIT